MPRVAPDSRSYWYADFEKLFEDAGQDMSLVCDIYARVSRASDERARSTEGQVEEAVELVLSHGMIPGMIHVDNSLSAWNQRIIRPAWNRIMERVENRETGAMAVWNLTRFSRRVKDGERLIHIVEKTGAPILDTDSKWDLRNPRHKKEFRNAVAEAEYYSDQLSKNVQRGKRHRTKKGDSNTGKRPFGYNLDLTIREDEAETLRWIYQVVIDGSMPLAHIRRHLNEQGILTSTGNKWAGTTLRNLLLRELNCGRITNHGEVMSTIKGEVIISESEFELVRSMLLSRRRGAPAKYLLTGLLVCGHCEDKKMYGRPYPKHNAYADGSVRRGYNCGFGCYQSIDVRFADAQVREIAVELASDPAYAHIVETTARDSEAEATRLNELILKHEQTAKDLAAKTLDWGIERVEAATRPIDAELKKLRAQLKTIAGRVADPTQERAASREAWLRRFDSLVEDPDRQRELISAALGNQIIVIAKGSISQFDPDRISLAERD